MDQTMQDGSEFAIWYLIFGLIRSVFALCSVRTHKRFYSQLVASCFIAVLSLEWVIRAGLPQLFGMRLSKCWGIQRWSEPSETQMLSLGWKALKASWALGYLEPESHCLGQSSLAGKCFVCIVHKRKTRGHDHKQSLRHERLSGTALQIGEDGFQISLKNRELVCVQGRVEAQGRVVWRLCVRLSVASCWRRLGNVT